MVRVISCTGKKLMNCSPRTARKLLKTGKAEVVGNKPFTIKLINGSSGYIQKNAVVRNNNKETCKLSTNQIIKIARKYYKTTDKRGIIRKVFRLSRTDGIEYMAKLVGVTPEYMYQLGKIDIYKKSRVCSRRGRKYTPQKENRYLGIEEMTNELAGGGEVFISGGKRTVHKCGSGNIRSAASEQTWQALMGN